MVHRTRILVRAVVAALFAALLVVVVAATVASREDLRRFVNRRFNPVVVRLGLVGGRRSPWSFIEHVGRRSGTVYRTPVLPLPAGDHVFIPLPYGTDVDWARNVRAAGHCRLQRHGATLELDEPAVVSAGENTAVPEWYRPILERRGRIYLRLHVLREQPGLLEDDAAAPAERSPLDPTSGPPERDPR